MKIKRLLLVVMLGIIGVLLLFVVSGAGARPISFPIVVTNVSEAKSTPLIGQFVSQLAVALQGKPYAASVTIGDLNWDSPVDTLNYRVAPRPINDHTAVIAVVTILNYRTPKGNSNEWYATSVVYVSDNEQPGTQSVAEGVKSVVENSEKYIPIGQ
jgi:hypothetical protein